MPEVFFERPYASVRWQDDLDGIYIQLVGYIPSEDFREVLEKALDFLKLKRASRWIVDLSEQKVTSIEDQNWIGKDWIPRCIGAGIKQVAMVLPKNVIAQMSLKRVNNIIDQVVAEVPPTQPLIDVKTANFGSVEEARQWMLNMSK